MQPTILVRFAIFLIVSTSAAIAASPAVGVVPKGDAIAVSSRIIKYNFPTCKRVTSAVRAPDGSIRARCDGTDYFVFTVFNAKEGKTIEVALNCTAAKNLLNESC